MWIESLIVFTLLSEQEHGVQTHISTFFEVAIVLCHHQGPLDFFTWIIGDVHKEPRWAEMTGKMKSGLVKARWIRSLGTEGHRVHPFAYHKVQMDKWDVYMAKTSPHYKITWHELLNKDYCFNKWWEEFLKVLEWNFSSHYNANSCI